MVHFAMLQTTKYCSRIQVKTHSTMLAIAPPPPQWLVLRKSCELIVLRVVREVIIFNNSNFTAVKKTALMRIKGVLTPNPPPPLATPLTFSLRASSSSTNVYCLATDALWRVLTTCPECSRDNETVESRTS